MPHRNLITIMLVAVLSLACYSRVDQGHYAAKLQQIMDHIHEDGLYQIERREIFEAAADAMTDAADNQIIERRELFEAAANAMADAVGDQNTAFEPKDQKEEINKQLSQEFGGVGAVLQLVNKRPRIAHVLLDGPAARAGLRPQDVVLSVDGKDTLEFAGDLREFTHAVTGEVGTSVQLTVEREGVTAPLAFTVTREKVFIDSVKGYVRAADGTWDYLIPGSEKIAYLRIEGSFGAKTYSELVDALKIIHQQEFAGLVIDLRNNPGGLLDAAQQICNLFLPANQVILTTRDRNNAILKSYETDGNGPYQEIPLAVLINKGSASASEIIAGCLKDLGRAVVVGQRSFGKGTVQQLFDVDGGRSMLRLSTANWCTASQRKIHRTRKNGGIDREQADESFEWGILPSEGYEVVIDNKQIARLFRHFDKLAYDAIDASFAPPKSKPEQTEAGSDSPHIKPPEASTNGVADAQDKGNSPESAAISATDELTADGEGSGENEPFVDVQLKKAVEAVERLSDREPHRRAA